MLQVFDKLIDMQPYCVLQTWSMEEEKKDSVYTWLLLQNKISK